MIFNLIPIPPLDGSKVLFAFLDRRTEYQIRPFLEQYGFFILLAILFFPPGNSIGSRIISPILDALLQPPGGRSRARQFRAHLRASVTPEERAALATWIAPAQLELFDTMHVADRRHGLDVVASLRAEGVTEPDLLVAGLLHDAGKGDTGVWPRVAYSLGEPLRRLDLARRERRSPGSAAHSSGCAPTPRRRPRWPRPRAARHGPSS